MSKKTRMLLLLCPLLLASCGANITLENKDLKGALNALKKGQNYTLTSALSTGEVTKVYYTKSAILKENNSGSVGYIQDKKGIYRIDLENKEWLPSALLKNDEGELYSSLWKNDFIYSFKDFDFSKLEYQDENIALIHDKMNLLTYLNLLDQDVNTLSTIQSLKVEKVQAENALTFTLSYRDQKQMVTTVSEVGSTTISTIEEFLQNGGKRYVNTKEQDRMIDLFSGFNYKRRCLDNDNETVVGHEWYNPNYFYGDWEDDYLKEHVGEVMEIGVIGLKNKQFNNQILNGSYYYYLNSQGMSLVTSAPVNENPDVTLVYNYPTYLELFSNFQYFKEATDYEDTIYTQNLDLMNDFCNNFQIAEILQTNHCSLSSLEISYDLKENNSECVVVFCLYYYYNNQLGAFMYPFVEFGNSNIAIVDYFLNN
ncbi:MAG: hypothetical protein KH380_02750 [Coprobacillus sp.]|nr:hypothetical protein [Coprobacillus sp.]